MDTRYQNPEVAALWGLPWTLNAWWRIERAVIRAQIDTGLISQAEADPLLTGPQPTFNETGPQADQLDRHAQWEEITKHDVAAFLATMREFYGEPHARWIHYGMTSSDLVDTTQGLRFAEMNLIFYVQSTDLEGALLPWVANPMPVLGRTHGQPAEPTAIGVRAAHWMANIRPAMLQLQRDSEQMRIAKISGPVGTYAHNPPAIESTVALRLGLSALAFGGSQIVPRGRLGRWANSAAEFVQACAKVAVDIRLMAMTGEAMIGSAAGQVGSSAMPHKNNPIRAEKITGLARLAAGYASMLQPLDLWLERDLSNSCVERVAVPDLWHVVMHVLEQTALLLTETGLSFHAAREELENHANEAWSHHTTLGAIQDGMNYDEAREFGLDVQVESYDIMASAKDTFLGNYPGLER